MLWVDRLRFLVYYGLDVVLLLFTLDEFGENLDLLRAPGIHQLLLIFLVFSLNQFFVDLLLIAIKVVVRVLVLPDLLLLIIELPYVFLDLQVKVNSQALQDVVRFDPALLLHIGTKIFLLIFLQRIRIITHIVPRNLLQHSHLHIHDVRVDDVAHVLDALKVLDDGEDGGPDVGDLDWSYFAVLASE